MVFVSPAWVPKLPMDPPDSIPLSEFILNEKYGRHPLGSSKDPFTCSISGKTYSASRVVERTEWLAKALAKEFNWSPNEGSEYEKVVGLFTVNTVDTSTLYLAVNRLGGISSPISAAYSVAEVIYQLKDSGAKCLFTCLPLLNIALKAAGASGIPRNRVYILDVPKELTGGGNPPREFKTLDKLIKEGSVMRRLETTKWENGDGARKTAFLCYSSGTSGLPKGVMISHRNVIANVMQITAFESKMRKDDTEPHVALGLLPQSHIYGLLTISMVSTYRGDQVIVLPKFELGPFLESIQRYKITILYLVPPIIIQMCNNQALLRKYDLRSVYGIFTGGAPLGRETAESLQALFPKWKLRQGYGTTESCTVVTSSGHDDIWYGSCGSLLPGYEARIVTREGTDITAYNESGELLVRSPSVVLGYLNNPKATAETFENGWMRTGDEVVMKKSRHGNEHLFVVDRIKELIKVKGLQVAPAELEAHLLSHPSVADCCVVPVLDEAAGEVPKAFVVKSLTTLKDDKELIRDIEKYVEDHKSRHKWLRGGVQFISAIPKSPSGKILRKVLRDQEAQWRKAERALKL